MCRYSADLVYVHARFPISKFQPVLPFGINFIDERRGDSCIKTLKTREFCGFLFFIVSYKETFLKQIMEIASVLLIGLSTGSLDLMSHVHHAVSLQQLMIRVWTFLLT